jgi:hypothetical protein
LKQGKRFRHNHLLRTPVRGHGGSVSQGLAINGMLVANINKNSSMRDAHIVWRHATVIRARREALTGYRSFALWFTGLSGSGKFTPAHTVEDRLHLNGCRTYVFDCDNVHHRLCSNLSFSIEHRTENVRRIGAMTKLFAAHRRPENKVSLSFVEGLINKILVIQRRAYGFHDEEYLRLKILTSMFPVI